MRFQARYSRISLRSALPVAIIACALPLGRDGAAAKAETLLETSRAALRPLSGFEEPYRGPRAWRRPEPEPQGRLGLREQPVSEKGFLGAVWRNVLVPGWGQRYLEAPGRGLLFMGAEAATWGTWGTFKFQESLRQDNYIEMAQVFGGVASTNHGDDYWKAVGQHANWLDYNQWLRYQARREYGFGSSGYYAYIAENEITAADSWDWDNFDRQLAYLEKRKASNNAERRATYTLYALLVNRVVAVVDAWRLHRSRESIREELAGERTEIGFQALPDAESLTLRLGLYRRF